MLNGSACSSCLKDSKCRLPRNPCCSGSPASPRSANTSAYLWSWWVEVFALLPALYRRPHRGLLTHRNAPLRPQLMATRLLPRYEFYLPREPESITIYRADVKIPRRLRRFYSKGIITMNYALIEITVRPGLCKRIRLGARILALHGYIRIGHQS